VRAGLRSQCFLHLQATMQLCVKILAFISSSFSEVWGAPSCAQRTGDSSWGPSACLIIQDRKALLVEVYYGHSPGWDFPGGHHHPNEFGCETAERETYEETGWTVKAMQKLGLPGRGVFKCEVVREAACTGEVDEGCLKKTWITKENIDLIKFRGGSWGDKRALLKQVLGGSAGWRDACGCVPPTGWSSHSNGCRHGSYTDHREANDCACGCTPHKTGWSSRSHSCRPGSYTSQREAAACQMPRLFESANGSVSGDLGEPAPWAGPAVLSAGAMAAAAAGLAVLIALRVVWRARWGGAPLEVGNQLLDVENVNFK